MASQRVLPDRIADARGALEAVPGVCDVAAVEPGVDPTDEWILDTVTVTPGVEPALARAAATHGLRLRYTQRQGAYHMALFEARVGPDAPGALSTPTPDGLVVDIFDEAVPADWLATAARADARLVVEGVRGGTCRAHLVWD